MNVQVDLGADRIKLQLIGPMQVLTGTGKDASPRSRKALALLGILALSPPGPVPRSRLAALLWERAEPDQARSLLRGAVHEVQARLRGANGDIIEAARRSITLGGARSTVQNNVTRGPSPGVNTEPGYDAATDVIANNVAPANA